LYRLAGGKGFWKHSCAESRVRRVGIGTQVKVKFAVEQAMKVQREVCLCSFFNLGARWRWVVNVKPWPLYARVRDLVPIV
jgi:hypothetical protein